MNSSEIQKRDGDTTIECNNYCIGSSISNIELKAKCESEFEFKAKCDAHFESSCIVKASSDLLLYFIAVLVGGLLIAALIFWARKRCKRRKEKRKTEAGTLIISDMGSRNTGAQRFPDETDSLGTKTPTYI